MAQHHDDDAPVWGAQAISKVISRTPRQTYLLLENGHIPARKVGKSYVAIPDHVPGRGVGAPASGEVQG